MACSVFENKLLEGKKDEFDLNKIGNSLNFMVWKLNKSKFGQIQEKVNLFTNGYFGTRILLVRLLVFWVGAV